MTSAEDFIDALNCTIRFTTPEGEYEGVLKRVFVPSRMITVGKILLLQSKLKLGTLNFMFHEVSNLKILERPVTLEENVCETSLVYFRPHIEGVFNLDGDSETESVCNINITSNEEEFVMKLLPCFSKCISSDSQIIDSFSNEFNSAIKLISSEVLIGVSLEGPKISRNGILTWLCISTPSCTYLFDILALGETSFQNGLKSIMENSKIKKIFHDCRFASDCLFHKYNVCLVNMFDTQVADSLVMMQESKNCSVIKQVNSLDDCLTYYLEVPDDHLYSQLNFSLDKRSSDYHGLRPLQHSFRRAMIKNVIYLPLLKRELETALLTPLRRATEVYLNVIQNASDRELMVAPPVIEELPPELLLEGIQVVRYQQYEYIPPIVKSGPPYRKLVNPIRDFIECCKKFETREEIEPSEDVNSQAMEANKFSLPNFANEDGTNSRWFSKHKYINFQRNVDDAFSGNESGMVRNPLKSGSNSDCIKESLMNEKIQDVSVDEKTIFNKMPSVFGDLSIKMEQGNEGEKNCVKIFIDPFAEGDKAGGKKLVVGNAYIRDCAAVLPENDCKEDKKNSNLSENEGKVSNPVGNCLLRPFNQMRCENSFSHGNLHLSGNECNVSNPVGKVFYEENLESTKSSTMITSQLSIGSSEMLFGQERKKPINLEDLWNEIRKECAAEKSYEDQSESRRKIRFVPAGMAGI